MHRLILSFIFAFSLNLCAFAQVDTYPNKPIRLVVPFPPGGTIEAMSRVIGEEMTKNWGQPILVDPKPGASGNIGVQLVANSPPDGYTLIFGTQGTHGTNSILFKDVRFDPFKDFEPITMVADAPLILVINPKMPVNNVNELVSYVKKQPAGLDYASASSGGGAHIAGEMFAKAANLKLVHVPYKGSGPARTDLIAGHISFMFDNIGSSLASARSGQLRALAVTGAKRTPSAPELPTMAEAGIEGVVIDTWYAIYAPAGTPASIVQKLNTEIVRVLKLPQVIAKFKTMGLDIVAGTSSELASRMKSDVGRYAKTIADAGIKVD